MSNWPAVAQELAWAARRTFRSGSYGLFAAVSLAAAFGANAAAFGSVYALLVRPPALVRSPEQLRQVAFKSPDRLVGFRTSLQAGYPAVEAIAGVNALDGVAAFSVVPVSIGRGADAVDARAVLVTPNYFTVLGTPAKLGTLFSNTAASADDRVAISEAFWARQFGRDRDVIGRHLTVGDASVVIAGVVPDAFRLGQSAAGDIWLQLGHPSTFTSVPAEWRTNRGARWLTAVGRVRPGASDDATERAVSEALATSVSNIPVHFQVTGVALRPLSNFVDGQPPRELKISVWLCGVTSLLLLISAANAANLFALKSISRRREYAVRAALGASLVRLRASLLADVTMVVGLAVLLGFGFDVASRNILAAFVPSTLAVPRAPFEPLSALALTVSAAVAFLIIAAFAIRQARLSASVSSLHMMSKGDSRGGLLSRSALLGVQAGLSLILLFLGGLFARSLERVVSLDLGVEADHTVQVTFRLPRTADQREAQSRVYRRAAELFRGAPGVRAVTLAEDSPFQFGRGSAPWTSAGPNRPDGRLTNRLELYPSGEVPYITVVEPGFFPVTAPESFIGRDFSPRDVAGAPRVAVVNRPLANRLSRDRDVLNECIYLDHAPSECTRVVGIVEGVWKHSILKRDKMVVYTPLAQTPNVVPGAMVVRTALEAERAVPQLRAALVGYGSELPPVSIVPVRHLFEWELRPWKLGTVMFGTLGVLAGALAIAGIFSVVSFTAWMRAREVAIRSALGASWPRLLLTVAAESALGVAAGLVAGAFLAVTASRVLADALFQVSSRDAGTLTAVVVLLAGVSVIALVRPVSVMIRRGSAAVLRSDSFETL